MEIARVESDVTADALFADVLLVGDDAQLALDTSTWPGVVWRIGHEALALHFEGITSLDARAMLERGVADGRIADWVEGRSELALDAAAMLIRNRGGDPLERAEFARLFAAGLPQEGLRAFLEKRKPRF